MGNGVCSNVGQLSLAELQPFQKWKQPLSPVGTSGNDTRLHPPCSGAPGVKGPCWSEVIGLRRSRAGGVPWFCTTPGKLELAGIW